MTTYCVCGHSDEFHGPDHMRGYKHYCKIPDCPCDGLRHAGKMKPAKEIIETRIEHMRRQQASALIDWLETQLTTPGDEVRLLRTSKGVWLVLGKRECDHYGFTAREALAQAAEGSK